MEALIRELDPEGKEERRRTGFVEGPIGTMDLMAHGTMMGLISSNPSACVCVDGWGRKVLWSLVTRSNFQMAA